MSRREGTRRFATILFTDIVRSTDIARELGDLRWRELVRRHHAIVRRELKRFDGREVDTAGDGFFAVFDSPGAAIRCAVAVAERVREVGLEVRAGLHAGEVVATDGKAGGIAVNTAARVMSVGAFGEVLVSQTVRELVAGSSLGFEDHGIHTLKGIEGEWRLSLVTSVDGERVPESLDPAEASRRRLAIEAPATARSARRPAALIAIGALAAIVAGVVAVSVIRDGDRGDAARTADPLVRAPAGPPAGSIVRLDAASGDIELVRADLPGTTASNVHEIEVVAGSVWNTRLPLILKVDLQDGSHTVVGGLEGDFVGAIGAGDDGLWVLGRLLYSIDPGTGKVREGIRYLGTQPTFFAGRDVEAGFGAVWIPSNQGLVIRVDPETGDTTELEIGDAPSRVAIGPGAVWILDSNVVWRIDPRTNAAELIPIAGRLREIAVGGGFVWVLDPSIGTLFPITEADGTVRPGVDVGAGATDVAFGLGSVWVARGGDVLEVDTTTARVVRTIKVGETPIAGLAVDEEDDALWLDIAPA